MSGIQPLRHVSAINPVSVVAAGLTVVGTASVLGGASLLGDDGPTICPTRQLTGFACPGCGLARGCGALLNGSFASAWSYHPLAPLAIVAMIVSGGWYAGYRLGLVSGPSPRVATGLLSGLLVALLTVWVARIATGTLPPV